MPPASQALQRVSFALWCAAGIAANFLHAAPSPQGGETPVTPNLGGDQVRPAVAAGATGGIVVWQDNATDGAGLGVSAQRLDASLGPVGDKFRVNAFPGGDQENARVALLPGGRAAVVWQGGRPGFQTIQARFVDVDGSFVTPEDVLVSQPSLFSKHMVSTNWQVFRNNRVRNVRHRFRHIVENRHESSVNPVVAALSDGSVVVAYDSLRKFFTNSMALMMDARWDDRRQHFITNTHRQPVTASAAPMQDVYFQRLSSNGEKLGDETAANSVRQNNQRNPAVVALPSGGFALCWLSETPVEGIGPTASPQNRVNTLQNRLGGGLVDVYVRIFDAGGTPAGPEFKVNTSALACANPSIAANASGALTVVWTQRDASRDNGWDIYYRTFDAAGAATRAASRVNTTTYGDQFAASVTSVGERQLLVWSSLKQDGSWEGVFARVLSGGELVTDEFRVNTTTHLRQIQPAASGAGTQAAVVWSSYSFESGFDLFLQRYHLP